MEYTDNILLNTPQDADGFDVGHFNDNSDFLDGIIGGDVSSIAAGEERNVATQAHTAGSYLTIKNGTMGGKLYKVTSAIAAGNVISTSTNVQETSLIKEIKTLQNSLLFQNITPSYTPASGVTVKSFAVIRWGKVVYVAFYFALTTTKTNNATLLSTGNTYFPRPAGYDPQSGVYDVTGYKGAVYIERAGDRNAIKCNGPVSTGSYLVAQFCYITDE